MGINAIPSCFGRRPGGAPRYRSRSSRPVFNMSLEPVRQKPWNRLPAEVRARLRSRPQPEWIAPMLATLTEERFSRQGWLFEPKWDGERCLAFRRGGDLRLFSRNRILLNDKYTERRALGETEARRPNRLHRMDARR